MENTGSKETGLEYDEFMVYVNFLNLGNVRLEEELLHRRALQTRAFIQKGFYTEKLLHKKPFT